MEPEHLADARREAQRRIDRREARAANLDRLVELDGLIAQVDRLLAAGMPIAGDALRAERQRLLEEHTRIRVAIHGTSTMSWGHDEGEVRARDGEGVQETTWRVLVDRGATGYEIAKLVVGGELRDSAIRKLMDRWRGKARAELKAFRADLLARKFPTPRMLELLKNVSSQLERIG